MVIMYTKIPDRHKISTKVTALSGESLLEIGRITVHFSILEWELVNLIHRLLGIPVPRARTITSELSFRGLQQLASSLVKERRPDRVDEFSGILKKVSACEDQRNIVSRSVWGAGGVTHDGNQIIVRTKYTSKQSKGLKFSRQEMTRNDLNAIAQAISIAAFDLEGFAASLKLKRPV